MTLQELFNQIHAGETVVVQLDLTAYHTLRVALLKKNSKQAKLMDAIVRPAPTISTFNVAMIRQRSKLPLSWLASLRNCVCLNNTSAN